MTLPMRSTILKNLLAEKFELLTGLPFQGALDFEAALVRDKYAKPGVAAVIAFTVDRVAGGVLVLDNDVVLAWETVNGKREPAVYRPAEVKAKGKKSSR